MRIEHISFWKQDLGLLRPYKIAGLITSVSENAFFKVTLANGKVGIGSASPSERVCKESMSDTLSALQLGAARLEHRDIGRFGAVCDELSALLAKTPGAAAAVNIALNDAYAQSHDIRIADMLGLRCDPLPTSVTIGIKSEDEVQEDLEEYMAQGFRIVKMKIGDELDRDIQIVRRVREWGGADLRIRVDANQGYSEDELIRCHNDLRPANVEFIEQPMMAPANDRLRSIPAEVRHDIMADEDLMTVQDATELAVVPRGYGSWNIKLMKSGGIGPSKSIGELAGWNNIPLMWGCMDESRVSIAAALHTAYSCRSTRYLDLDGSFDLARDIASGGFKLVDGCMHLTDEPGLGVKLVNL